MRALMLLPSLPISHQFKKVLVGHTFAEVFSKMPNSDLLPNNTATFLFLLFSRDVGGDTRAAGLNHSEREGAE